ncbi:MAG TPA: DUF4288 domain-containing protein [Prosthecobacter sp.]|nr:DUF4288 domain-containing protein [Prosthecobacter sp.]HRK13880.1 DUF4288 domain-containing protein [Prosthecobacter sp.]
MKRSKPWYAATLIVEVRVEGRKTCDAHLNTVLIQAASPEDAHAKALVLGKEADADFINLQGRKAVLRFRGLRDLTFVCDELEHGAEILWRRKARLNQAGIRRLMTRKSELGVFKKAGPLIAEIMPADTAEVLLNRAGKSRPGR